ncbi:MAG TPA: hypothetical protein VHI95_16340 [Acidimicrobiales bacterium]|jgi:hypothetical protein|nr:hypothetical protein [Acidimicrobiales bacterium]
MSTLAERATAWADGAWDEPRGLLWNPPGSFEDYGLAPKSVHMVPQSAWYAVGLLARGDTARAERVLEELCALQYDRPGVVWNGTFARFAEWPEPPETGAVQWVDYDPNWRQFLGTTFAVILKTFDVSAAVAARLHQAMDRAIAGEPRDRVPPSYSNIALMKAWLEGDEKYAASVVDCFDEFGAFEEYGSPTYYGIDLYALALWRRHPPTPAFAAWGDRVWTELWRDIARWWHPRLRNLCGPYSRAYGMDMTRYVGLLGLWLPEPVVPSLSSPFDHSHDVTMAPLIDLVGSAAADVTFNDGERVVEQALPGGRVASGWISADVMAGGERGGRFRAEGQYHPATVHWLLPDGSVGWLRLRHAGPLSATASNAQLQVTVHDHHRLGRQPVVVDASVAPAFARRDWSLPGLTIRYDGPSPDMQGVIDAGGDEVLTLRF